MKKIDMKKIFSKFNGKTKKIIGFGGAAIILGGTIALVSCNHDSEKVNDASMSSDNTNSNDSDVKESLTTTTNNVSVVDSDVVEPDVLTVDATDIETMEVTIESENEDNTDSNDFEPAVVYMTAEDLVKLSKSYAEYINKVGVFNQENCNYDKFEAKDLYSAVYLSNIDCFTDKETRRLIDNGIINDDIGSVVVNSFGFFNFYQTDTYHKVQNGDQNFIDLSMLFANDSKAENVFETMTTVLNDMGTNDTAKVSSNFIDTYAYFAAGVELPVSDYDYSKSIYTSDRSQLSVGSMYALSYTAEVIKDLSVEKGVTTWAIGNTFSRVINDRSNIVRIFEGCVIEPEKNEEPKVLTK